MRAGLTIPTNIVVAASKNGWMTSSVLSTVWGESAYGNRRLLVLHSYHTHMSADKKDKAEDLNTDLIIIPG